MSTSVLRRIASGDTSAELELGSIPIEDLVAVMTTESSTAHDAFICAVEWRKRAVARCDSHAVNQAEAREIMEASLRLAASQSTGRHNALSQLAMAAAVAVKVLWLEDGAERMQRLLDAVDARSATFVLSFAIELLEEMEQQRSTTLWPNVLAFRKDGADRILNCCLRLVRSGSRDAKLRACTTHAISFMIEHCDENKWCQEDDLIPTILSLGHIDVIIPVFSAKDIKNVNVMRDLVSFVRRVFVSEDIDPVNAAYIVNKFLDMHYPYATLEFVQEAFAFSLRLKASEHDEAANSLEPILTGRNYFIMRAYPELTRFILCNCEREAFFSIARLLHRYARVDVRSVPEFAEFAAAAGRPGAHQPRAPDMREILAYAHAHATKWISEMHVLPLLLRLIPTYAGNDTALAILLTLAEGCCERGRMVTGTCIGNVGVEFYSRAFTCGATAFGFERAEAESQMSSKTFSENDYVHHITVCAAKVIKAFITHATPGAIAMLPHIQYRDDTIGSTSLFYRLIVLIPSSNMYMSKISNEELKSLLFNQSDYKNVEEVASTILPTILRSLERSEHDMDHTLHTLDTISFLVYKYKLSRYIRSFFESSPPASAHLRTPFSRTVFAAVFHPGSQLQFGEMWDQVRARLGHSPTPKDVEMFFRDARGVFQAATTNAAFELAFKAFSAMEPPVTRWVLSALDNDDVLCSFLHLMIDVANDNSIQSTFTEPVGITLDAPKTDKVKRISGNSFTVSSLFLFKWICSLSTQISTHLITQTHRIKPARLLLELMARAIGEEFVNLSFFELYRDPSINRLETAGFSLMEAFASSLDDKISLAASRFAEAFSRTRMEQLSRAPTHVLSTIFTFATRLLNTTHEDIYYNCCKIIENFYNFIYFDSDKTKSIAIQQFLLTQHHGLFQHLCCTALFNNTHHLTPTCRALFALIVVHPHAVNLDPILSQLCDSERRKVSLLFTSISSDARPLINDTMHKLFFDLFSSLKSTNTHS